MQPRVLAGVLVFICIPMFMYLSVPSVRDVTAIQSFPPPPVVPSDGPVSRPSPPPPVHASEKGPPPSALLHAWRLTPAMFPSVSNVTTAPTSTHPITRPRRNVIGAEKVRKHFGLTNQMMFYAAMISYAVSDGRDVVFPVDAELPFYSLFDVPATQAALDPSGVRILTPDDVRGLKPTFYKKKIPLPKRELCVTNDEDAKVKAWYKIQRLFNDSRTTPYVVQGDFYLRWPFGTKTTGTTGDICTWMAKLQFPHFLKNVALRVLSSMPGRRVMSVHLRLEVDAVMLMSSSATVSPAALEKHFRIEIFPLAKSLRIDSIYICSGKLKSELSAVFERLNRDKSHPPIFTKADFAVSVTIPDSKGKWHGHETTNHYAAAVDLIIMERSTAAIVSAYSSLAINVLSRTCHRNGVGVFLHSLRKSGQGFSRVMYSPCDRPLLHHCNHQGVQLRPQIESAQDLFT